MSGGVGTPPSPTGETLGMHIRQVKVARKSIQSYSLAVDPSLDGTEASRQADNRNVAGGQS